MASRKTAHRRRRVHSSKRRKNVKSRKVMRGGDNLSAAIRRCNAKGGILAPKSPDKDFIIKVALNAKIVPNGEMCSNLVKGNHRWEKPYVRPSSQPPSSF
jgi:hypothetical protein